MSGGSILLAVAGLGILGSYFKITFTIKGPLGKEITRIIENHFGEPVEIKAKYRGNHFQRHIDFKMCPFLNYCRINIEKRSKID